MAHWEANWTLKVGVIQRAASGQFLRVSLGVILSSVPVLTAQSTVHSAAGVSSTAPTQICTHNFGKTRTQYKEVARDFEKSREKKEEKHPGDGKEKVM